VTSRDRLPLSRKARRTGEQPISFLMAAALANPDLISFAAGFVDPETLPVEETAAIARRILSEPARAKAALQYDTTLGLAPLREKLLQHLEQLEGKPAAAMGLTPRHVIVTTGSQQAIYIIGDVLLDEGDIVLAEAPSYFVYTGALASFGARVIGIPMDDDGMRVDLLEKELEHLKQTGELGRVKLIYTVSYYQNPTGLTLSADRRPRVLELAKKYSQHHRILVLEDAAYRELQYAEDHATLPSIKSYDAENKWTVLGNTFSKPFAPGLKTGWSVMPDDLLQAVLDQKGNHDFGSPSLCQHVALESLRDGSYGDHLHVLRRGYKAKRDAMIAALKKHMPAGVKWTEPQGGLYVWVTMPSDVDTTRTGPLFTESLRQGVLYVPGDYCFLPDAQGRVPTNQMRLCFASVDPKQIEPGVERLASAVKAIAKS
jgi:2-aminoadipate transaminase